MRGLLLIRSSVAHDHRGYLWEVFHQRRLSELEGLAVGFVQENQSFSQPKVLRGLHYQLERPQGKLIRAIAGEVFDVAVDLRRRSPTLGQWYGVRLRGGDGRQLWVPPGFAHGFLVIAPEGAHVGYSLTTYYDPGSGRTIRWDDPKLAIDWPLAGDKPVVSDKDRRGVDFSQADLFP